MADEVTLPAPTNEEYREWAATDHELDEYEPYVARHGQVTPTRFKLMDDGIRAYAHQYEDEDERKKRGNKGHYNKGCKPKWRHARRERRKEKFRYESHGTVPCVMDGGSIFHTGGTGTELCECGLATHGGNLMAERIYVNRKRYRLEPIFTSDEAWLDWYDNWDDDDGYYYYSYPVEDGVGSLGEHIYYYGCNTCSRYESPGERYDRELEERYADRIWSTRANHSCDDENLDEMSDSNTYAGWRLDLFEDEKDSSPRPSKLPVSARIPRRALAEAMDD